MAIMGAKYKYYETKVFIIEKFEEYLQIFYLNKKV